MPHKTMSSYRISNSTRDQMEWLQERLGGISETAVITLAVADLYEKKQEEFRTQLTRMGDMYIFSVGGIPIAGVDANTYSRLPKGAREKIASGSRNALVDLVLELHKKKTGKITFFPEGMQQVYGPTS